MTLEQLTAEPLEATPASVTALHLTTPIDGLVKRSMGQTHVRVGREATDGE